MPMWEMKSKVPQLPAPKTLLSVQESAQGWAKLMAEQSDHGSADGSRAPMHPRPAGEREITVSRLWRFSPWVLGLLAAAPLAPAMGQNLDAGKSGAQIFSEVCSNCHRSPRELRSNPGASFLREHYTTGSEMASTMSAYLSGSGTGAGAAQQKRPPSSVAPGTTTTREAPPSDSARDPRRAQQTPEPKVSPAPPSAKGRPVTAEVKPAAAPPPAKPALEEFEE
jgi:mono/diheme cytochrome c family protein